MQCPPSTSLANVWYKRAPQPRRVNDVHRDEPVQVAKATSADFEAMWRERESYLHELEGFLGFHLLRGPERDDQILYVSHTMWRGYADFIAWTKSEQFRRAHAAAGASRIRSSYVNSPEFEGFSVIQELKADGTVTHSSPKLAAKRMG